MGILFAALGAALIYLLQRRLYVKFWDKGLTAVVSFGQEAITEGGEGTLREEIINNKILPLPMLRVKFQVDKSFLFQNEGNVTISDRCYKNDIFSVMFYQKVVRRLSFTGTKRGYYTIDQIDMVSTNLFMAENLVTKLPAEAQLYVYPRSVDTRRLEIPFRKMMGTILTNRYSYEDPFEFRGIRQYQSYDSMRDVNWKASAKTGELKVNVHDYTARQEVYLLLNLELDGLLIYEALREESIRIALSLSEMFVAQGVPTGILSNGCDLLNGEEFKITSGSGRGHMNTIREMLSRIDLSKPCRRFAECLQENSGGLKKLDTDTLFVLISTSQRNDLREAYVELTGRNVGSIWIQPLHKEMDQQGSLDSSSFELIRWEVSHEA